MTICSLCWQSYLQHFLTNEQIMEKYNNSNNFLDLINSIRIEISNSQLFYEIFIMSQDPIYNNICDNCHKYSLDITYKLYIKNLYDMLLNYCNKNNHLIDNIKENEKQNLIYIIKRYSGNSKEYFLKIFGYPLILEEANVLHPWKFKMEQNLNYVI